MTELTRQQKRTRAKASAEGRQVRGYGVTGLPWKKDPTTARREYKRLQRAKAGVKPRAEITKETEQKRVEQQQKRIERSLSELHDAHVKRFKYLKSARDRAANRYKNNPDADKSRLHKAKMALVDSYVVQQLKAAGFAPSMISKELVELKRESMQFRRIAKDIKVAVKNHLKEDHESI